MAYLLPYPQILLHLHTLYIDFSIVLLTVRLLIPCVTLCCLCHTALLYLGQVAVVVFCTKTNKHMIALLTCVTSIIGGCAFLEMSFLRSMGVHFVRLKCCNYFAYCLSTDDHKMYPNSIKKNRRMLCCSNCAGFHKFLLFVVASPNEEILWSVWESPTAKLGLHL